MTRLKNSTFALGGTRFLWTLDRSDSFALLDAYSQEFDYPFIDSADSYVQWVEGRSGGESEELIGEWITSRKKRETVFLCTKVGKKRGREGLGFENIVNATRDSLRRLQCDNLDLLMLHTWTKDSDVVEMTNALSFLYKSGLVCHLGVSNFPPKILKEIHSELIRTVGVGITFVQYHYNLIERDASIIEFDGYTAKSNFGFESKILPWAEYNNVISMPYHPLARGFLSEKYLKEPEEIISIHQARVLKYFGFNIKPLLLEMKKMSEEHHTHISNIALAWLISKGKLILPVVSFSSVHQMLSLVNLPVLTDYEINLLTKMSDKIERIDG